MIADEQQDLAELDYLFLMLSHNFFVGHLNTSQLYLTIAYAYRTRAWHLQADTK